MDAVPVTGQRILVVDDHAGFRATARRWLEAEGWTVVGEAFDGASALVAVASLRPDVVLLDVGLPDMDGFAVADRLAGGGAPDVILVSSRDPGAYAGRIATSRAIGFIAKADLDPDGLRAMLDSVRR
jgi:two-component system nitrate/nitrite response regulator NarL